MNSEQALEFLRQISEEYGSIREPKYRNAGIDRFKELLERMNQLREYLKDDKIYKNLLNGISQAISKIERTTNESTWRNVSDRGMNKAIHPVTNKSKHPVTFPLEWIDPKSGQSCYINEGYWDEKNFMVMDAIGYMLLLKEGGDKLPEMPSYIFNNISNIHNLELSLYYPEKNVAASNIDVNISAEHKIKFSDADFRKFTSQDLSSNQIHDLIHETSKVEFKLCFPVRMKDKQEKIYQMNYYSRFFEFGFINSQTRKDGIIQSREYYVTFSTLLGKLFVNNLLSCNNDWIESNFYMLPSSAQLFYRQFIIHHDMQYLQINMDTIRDRLHLYNTNITEIKDTIENNVLTPLVERGFLVSFEREDNSMKGIKYILVIPPK